MLWMLQYFLLKLLFCTVSHYQCLTLFTQYSQAYKKKEIQLQHSIVLDVSYNSLSMLMLIMDLVLDEFMQSD